MVVKSYYQFFCKNVRISNVHHRTAKFTIQNTNKLKNQPNSFTKSLIILIPFDCLTSYMLSILYISAQVKPNL